MLSAMDSFLFFPAHQNIGKGLIEGNFTKLNKIGAKLLHLKKMTGFLKGLDVSGGYAKRHFRINSTKSLGDVVGSNLKRCQLLNSKALLFPGHVTQS